MDCGICHWLWESGGGTHATYHPDLLMFKVLYSIKQHTVGLVVKS